MKDTVLFLWENIENKFLYLLKLCLYIFISLLMLVFPVLLGSLIGDFFNCKGKDIYGGIFLVICIFIVIFLLQSCITVILNKEGIRIATYIRKQFINKLIYMEMSEIYKLSFGDVSSRITNDMGQISEVIISIVPNMVKNISLTLIIVLILLKMNPVITCILIIMMIFTGIVVNICGLYMEKLYSQQQGLIGNISSCTVNILKNMEIIKTYCGEKSECNKTNNILDKFKHNSEKIVKFEVVSNIVLTLLLITEIGVLLFVAETVTTNKGIEVVAISTYILYIGQIIEPILGIINNITDLYSSRPSIKRIDSVLRAESEINSECDVQKNLKNNEITFNDVKFSYKQEGGLNISKAVFPSNSITAITGMSGSGKSTLFYLLLGLLKSYTGIIKIGSEDISKIDKKKLRKVISYVPQRNFLFYGDVVDNLRYGKNEKFSRQEIIKILENKNMMKLFNDLEEGIYTLINENAENLSEGQKRRINFARAILDKPFLLLLDEHTSGLDECMEDYVMDLVTELKKETTVVMIAHRKNVINKADKIYELKNSNLIERNCF